MICNVCNIDKDEKDFRKQRRICKKCFYKKNKKDRLMKKEGVWKRKIEYKTENDISYKTCSVCEQLKPFEDYEEFSRNKDGIKSYCKTCSLDKTKDTELNGPTRAYPHTNINGVICKKCTVCMDVKPLEDFSPLKKTWDKLNPCCKRCRTEKQQKYAKHKYHNDPEYRQKELKRTRQTQKRWRKERVDHRIRMNLSRRIRRAMMGIHKSEATMELLGCSLSEFIEYIENQFDEKMKWENYGKDGWELDHIIPCANFNLENPEEQKKCFHYTNLQPLWHTDNLSKAAKLDWQKMVKNV